MTLLEVRYRLSALNCVGNYDTFLRIRLMYFWNIRWSYIGSWFSLV